jgi:hypothetical protein
MIDSRYVIEIGAEPKRSKRAGLLEDALYIE